MELEKGETFASLLNIHTGDIHVVPTHLVFPFFRQGKKSWSKSTGQKCSSPPRPISKPNGCKLAKDHSTEINFKVDL
jgi:hypothetical protein